QPGEVGEVDGLAEHEVVLEEEHGAVGAAGEVPHGAHGVVVAVRAGQVRDGDVGGGVGDVAVEPGGVRRVRAVAEDWDFGRAVQVLAGGGAGEGEAVVAAVGEADDGNHAPPPRGN